MMKLIMKQTRFRSIYDVLLIKHYVYVKYKVFGFTYVENNQKTLAVNFESVNVNKRIKINIE